MSYETFRTVCQAIRRWQPRNYRSEIKYTTELAEYLTSTLNVSGTFYPAPKHTVKTRAGKSRADIAIDDKVAVELKYNLADHSFSEIRRLRDQILDHGKNFDYVAVVLCGNTRADQIQEIESGLGDKTQRGVLFSTQTVEIIPKPRSSTSRT